MAAGEIMTTAQTYKLKALTDLWTGDARGKPDRLITTGLLGSIRWWFEVVVRGLGGSACDPTLDGNRCPDSRKEPREPGHHCVVCELFGCTDWARKFRFDVLGDDDGAQQNQIKADQRFQLRFTPLRAIGDEEWVLLDLTLRLIAEYGAIGGKTVYKPSDESSRHNASHHCDYGLCSIEQSPDDAGADIETLCKYVNDQRWRHPDHNSFAWASLANFWCVKSRHLARQSTNQSTFNGVIGRPESKAQAGQNDSWLAGRRAGQGGGPESKKVFSFKNPARTFGFVKPGTISFDDMLARLRSAWGHQFADDEFLGGSAILDRLLKGTGGKP